MKAFLKNVELNYSDLTWEQLCDPGLLVVDDGLPPYKLNEQAVRDRDRAFDHLIEFCEQSNWQADVALLALITVFIGLLSGFIVLISRL